MLHDTKHGTNRKDKTILPEWWIESKLFFVKSELLIIYICEDKEEIFDIYSAQTFLKMFLYF